MPSSQDLQTNRKVRSIFVKHWIDLGRLTVRTVSGRCHIRGRLMKLPGLPEDMAPSTVDLMLREVKRICGRGNVRAELENWTNDSGFWKPVEAEAARPSLDRTGKSSMSFESKSFIMADNEGRVRSKPDDPPENNR